jgi:hypothetical protein
MAVFLKGTKESYELLASKDPNAWYIITDTHELFIGEELYTEHVRFYTDELPETPATGVLYIDEDNGTGSVHDGANWATIIRPIVKTIGIAATDSQVPSAKAVRDYVNGKITDLTEGDGVVVDVVAGDDPGTLKVVMGDESESDVVLEGLAHSVEYNSSTLTLTIPMVGSAQPLVINLPRDNFVESGYYDGDTSDIVLILKDETEVKIPAVDLIDIYTSGSGANDTVKIAVNSDNEISATIAIDTSYGILGVAADGKLTVNLAGYVTEDELADMLGDMYELIDEETSFGDIIADKISDAIDDFITDEITPLKERVSALENAALWGTF